MTGWRDDKVRDIFEPALARAEAELRSAIETAMGYGEENARLRAELERLKRDGLTDLTETARRLDASERELARCRAYPAHMAD